VLARAEAAASAIIKASVEKLIKTLSKSDENASPARFLAKWTAAPPKPVFRSR